MSRGGFSIVIKVLDEDVFVCFGWVWNFFFKEKVVILKKKKLV